MAGKSAVKILVVEDNPAVLELLRKGLKDCGEVVTDTDGADALLKAIEEKPDLIVSDFQMPGLNGRQFYEKLRARDELKKTPFIFLASKGDIEEKLRQFVTDGVEDYVANSRTKKVADRLHLEK